jgi:hypothetical protein
MIRCLTAVVATRPRVPMFVVLYVLYGATLFLSAFLLFVIQPMIARMLLPRLGGAAAVWTTCLVFFQTALLAGYAYAHGSTTVLGVHRQVWPHVLLMLLPLAVLPIHLRTDAPSSTENPIAWLLLALVTSIGLPFFALSTSAAVLQKWYSLTDDERAGDPYFLYAASNLGSLTALLAYPTLIEPTLRLHEQSRWWTIGYVAFAVLVALCAVVVWRQPGAQVDRQASADTDAVTWRRRGRWLALAFIPSSLLLGVTTHISTDIAAVPLLWIVPLSLYLLTFIIAFRGGHAAIRTVSGRLMPILIVPLALFLVVQFNEPMAVVIPFHLLTFLVIALVCHGELADDRPSRAHLTELYLWMSVGGTLGGLFNALIAPALFDVVVEYPLVLALSGLVIPASLRAVAGRSSVLLGMAFPVLVGALAIGAVLVSNRQGFGGRWLLIALLVPAVLAFSQRRHRWRFAACVAAILVSGLFIREPFIQPLLTERTFFGVYRVTENSRSGNRTIVHGTTIHGVQSTRPERRSEPLSYYHRTGPIGQVFASVPAASMPGEIAVAGLGTGSLASYRAPNQRVTFYELDPIVERLARNPSLFTYLSDCGSHCVVVTGDARLSLARASPGQFRIIVLDTFSSDAIPVHLLTREALSLYLSKLDPGGVLAVHVSNMHVAVDVVTARLAQDAGLVALWQSDSDSLIGKLPSDWMVLARRREDFGPLADDPRWITPVVPPDASLWTDDFSNVVGVLK